MNRGCPVQMASSGKNRDCEAGGRGGREISGKVNPGQPSRGNAVRLSGMVAVDFSVSYSCLRLQHTHMKECIKL